MKKVIVVTIFYLFGIQSIAHSQVVVIAHKNSPVSNISSASLSNLYLGEINKLSNGTKVIPLDLKKGNEAKEIFYEAIFGKSVTKMQGYWMEKLLTGRGKPPKSFSSEEGLLREVASDISAIGYVSISNVNGDVKVLTLDGAKPGENGYKLN